MVGNDIEILTEPEEQIIDLLRDLCDHGYGELSVRVQNGKLYMVHTRKDIKIDDDT